MFFWGVVYVRSHMFFHAFIHLLHISTSTPNRYKCWIEVLYSFVSPNLTVSLAMCAQNHCKIFMFWADSIKQKHMFYNDLCNKLQHFIVAKVSRVGLALGLCDCRSHLCANAAAVILRR